MPALDQTDRVRELWQTMRKRDDSFPWEMSRFGDVKFDNGHIAYRFGYEEGLGRWELTEVVNPARMQPVRSFSSLPSPEAVETLLNRLWWKSLEEAGQLTVMQTHTAYRIGLLMRPPVIEESQSIAFLALESYNLPTDEPEITFDLVRALTVGGKPKRKSVSDDCRDRYELAYLRMGVLVKQCLAHREPIVVEIGVRGRD